MNKGEFIRAMADNAELTLKEATVAYDAFVGALTEALQRGEKVQLVGFGTFEVHQKAAREGINPQNGLPHPATRIENAMNEAKVKIDPFKSVDEQVQIALKAIKVLIPIKFEKVRVAVRLPNTATGQAYSAIRPFGKIITYTVNVDSNLNVTVEKEKKTFS